MVSRRPKELGVCTDMRHLMLDIETLASTPNAAVIGIGAVVFKAGGIVASLETYINPAYAIGDRSPTTAEFWKEQHATVVDRVFSGLQEPKQAAEQFADFVKLHKPHTIWAGPVTFDVPILRSMFRAVGVSFPFHYRAERDCRTIWQVAKEYGCNSTGIMERTEEYLKGTFWKHNPLHDSVFQTYKLLKALNYLNGNARHVAAVDREPKAGVIS